jgi:peptide/nickel transport system permease protein
VIAGLLKSGVRIVASLVAVSVAVFLMLKAMPADPARLALQSWNLPPTGAAVHELQHAWGLDRPLAVQYGLWLVRFVGGDWGRSFRTGEPILHDVADRLPLSLGLGLGALVLALLVALPIGYGAACRPRGAFDRASRVLAVVTQALPAFWVGLALIWLLGVRWHWIQPFSPSASTFLLGVALVALHALGTFTRVYRRALLDAARQPFFQAALAKGLSRAEALAHHAHPHALYAVLASVRAEAGWAIGAGATIEVLFGLPGLGLYLVQAAAARDYLVLQAYVMTVALWLAVANLVLDAALGQLAAMRGP